MYRDQFDQFAEFIRGEWGLKVKMFILSKG